MYNNLKVLDSETQACCVRVANVRRLWVGAKAVVLVWVCLAACARDEDQDTRPYPGDLIDGVWTGVFVSENTGQQKSFEAILCYGFDPEILPPYYYDLAGWDRVARASRIASTERNLVGVEGVFEIRSDHGVDTLAANGGFTFECGLHLDLSSDGFYSRPYELRSGMIDNDIVQGSYKESGLEDGQRAQIGAGTWSGTRTVRLKPATPSRTHNPTQGG